MLHFEGHYQYAICIDLVTTCWEHRNLSQTDAVDRQEIIGKLKSLIIRSLTLVLKRYKNVLDVVFFLCLISQFIFSGSYLNKNIIFFHGAFVEAISS